RARPVVEIVSSEAATGPAIRFFEKRPPSVIVSFLDAAAASEDARSSGHSGTRVLFGDKSLLYRMKKSQATGRPMAWLLLTLRVYRFYDFGLGFSIHRLFSTAPKLSPAE